MAGGGAIGTDKLAFEVARRLKRPGVQPRDVECVVDSFAGGLGLDAEDLWYAVERAWPKVRGGADGDAFGSAAARAEADPQDFPRCDRPKLRAAANIAYRLDEASGGKPFPFGTRRLAAALGVKLDAAGLRSVGRLRMALVDRGLLVCTDDDWEFGRKAQVFKWIGPRGPTVAAEGLREPQTTQPPPEPPELSGDVLDAPDRGDAYEEDDFDPGEYGL